MDENLMKRVLPHSIEAEQSVIGSMLMDRDAIIAASEIVTADEFYQHQYGVMFEAMVELFNEGKPVDLVTLQDRLKEKDVPPEVSSLDFVRDIITMVRQYCPGESSSQETDKDNRRDCQYLLCGEGEAGRHSGYDGEIGL